MDQKTWNTFVISSPEHTFLHSWEWGELQEHLHVPYWRLVIAETEQVQAVALVIKRTLPFGKSWLYIPRGPVFAPAVDRASVIQKLQEELEQLGDKQQALFIRLDPAWPASRAHELTAAGWVKSEREVQPRDTVIVDLQPSEDDLLRGMHQKTRYNIKIAQKHDVRTTFTGDPAAVDTFLTLARSVNERANFHYHPDDYYHAMHTVLAPAGMFEVAIAQHNDTPLAAHLLISFGNTTTYAHGASSSTQRQVMAPHLLQWESLKRAREHGRAHYDFFGVAPADADAKHSWAGITRFKEGFGGRRETYVGTHDLILDRLGYTGFTFARRVRKLWR